MKRCCLAFALFCLAAAPACAGGMIGSAQIAADIKARIPALLAGQDVISALQDDKLVTFPAAVAVADNEGNLPAPPDDGLVQDIQSITQPVGGYAATPQLVWLRTAGIGGVFTVQGGDNCQTWKMFTLGGAQTHETQTPAFLDNPICALDGEESYLGFFGQQPVALLAQDLGLQFGHFGFRLYIDSWTGAAWDPGAMFTVTYDFPAANPKPLQIVCLSADCAGITRVGLDVANRFSVAQTFPAITSTTPPADLAYFQNYTANNSTDCADAVVPADLADNQTVQDNNITGPAMATFGDDALLFPSRLDGKLIFGCIGHAVYPPHTTSANLLLEFYVPTQGGLQAIDAMQFAPDASKIHIVSVLDNR